MKRIIYFFILLLAVACEKESVDPLLGDWSLVDYTSIGSQTGKVDASTDVKTWTFDEDGNIFVNSSDTYRYSIRDKKMTITYKSDKVTYQIEEISDKRLKVYWHTPAGAYQQDSDNWYTFVRIRR